MHPGLDKSNIDEFWINLFELSEKICMFPHPQDLLSSACKVLRDNDLMIAATSATLTPFPRTITLNNMGDLRDQSANRGVVIKRDFSDSSTCTFLPGKHRSRLVESKYLETQDSYEGIKKLPCPSWIAQPYIPALVDKGELRAYVAGGKLMYSIHTWESNGQDGMNMEVVDNYTPLDLLM
jgi:hypothetical protein